MKKLLCFLALAVSALGQVNSGNSVQAVTVSPPLTGSTTGTLATSYKIWSPLIVAIKSMTVVTSGAAVDIGSITIPPGITRWTVENSTSTNGLSGIIAETAAGTLAGGAFAFWTGPGGTGTRIWNNASGPSAAGVKVGLIEYATNALFTSSKIYVNQAGNSANTGTLSAYFVILPMP